MIERDVAEYVLKHADEIINDLRNQSWFVGDIAHHNEYFVDQVCSEFALTICFALHQSYVDVAEIITPQFLQEYLGVDIFKKIACAVTGVT